MALAAATLEAGATSPPEAEQARAAPITKQEARAWRPDARAARRYANRRTGRVTFTVVDMAGRFHRHDGHHKVPMASTFKVMLMVAYLRQESVDHRKLSKSERAMIRRMIRRSDNTAATRIRDMLGRGPIETLASRARMKNFEWNAIWGYCRTSARDQAFFMRTLRRYVPKRHWLFARRQLANIIRWQRWGVGQVKPAGWDLYFKGGWGSGSGAVDHQVAQLRNGHRRIGIGVTTEGNPSHDYGKQTLEGVFRRLLRGVPR